MHRASASAEEICQKSDERKRLNNGSKVSKLSVYRTVTIVSRGTDPAIRPPPRVQLTSRASGSRTRCRLYGQARAVRLYLATTQGWTLERRPAQLSDAYAHKCHMNWANVNPGPPLLLLRSFQNTLKELDHFPNIAR